MALVVHELLRRPALCAARRHQHFKVRKFPGPLMLSVSCPRPGSLSHSTVPLRMPTPPSPPLGWQPHSHDRAGHSGSSGCRRVTFSAITYLQATDSLVFKQLAMLLPACAQKDGWWLKHGHRHERRCCCWQCASKLSAEGQHAGGAADAGAAGAGGGDRCGGDQGRMHVDVWVWLVWSAIICRMLVPEAAV